MAALEQRVLAATPHPPRCRGAADAGPPRHPSLYVCVDGRALRAGRAPREKSTEPNSYCMCSHTDTKRASRVSCGKRAQKRAPHNLNAGMASSSVASSSSTKYIPFGDKKAQHGIIFLHGWKMSASSMKRSVAEALGGEPLPDTVFYFLTSPYTSEDGETRSGFLTCPMID